jgi:hypothetical protein
MSPSAEHLVAVARRAAVPFQPNPLKKGMFRFYLASADKDGKFAKETEGNIGLLVDKPVHRLIFSEAFEVSFPSPSFR